MMCGWCDNRVAMGASLGDRRVLVVIGVFNSERMSLDKLSLTSIIDWKVAWLNSRFGSIFCPLAVFCFIKMISFASIKHHHRLRRSTTSGNVWHPYMNRSFRLKDFTCQAPLTIFNSKCQPPANVLPQPKVLGVRQSCVNVQANSSSAAWVCFVGAVSGRGAKRTGRQI